MQQTYKKCIEKLQEFKDILIAENNVKTGKLYFLWIESKTNKIQNEKNEMYIYNNLIGITLKNYRIDKYNYERLDRKLKNIVDNNYILKNNNYIFNNNNISISDAKLLVTKILLRRGNVVWIDFGFNIGNEFGGMHPAIILKNFDSELFVLPLSSKKPKEYIKIEQEYKNKKISLEECKKKKDNITEIIELDSIYRFKNMIRWGNITRIRKVSILRLNFYGTIGKIDGKYMNTISKQISIEFSK